jgi:phage replication O-like protein O
VTEIDPGYTGIPNEIVEALYKINLSPYEWRVLMYLLRKTYGWHKTSDRIALSQFTDDIDIDRRLVHRTLKTLSHKKIIVIEKDEKARPVYSVQTDHKSWVSSPRMTRQRVISTDDKLSSPKTTSVISTDDKLSSPETPTKERNNSQKKLSKEKAAGAPQPLPLIPKDMLPNDIELDVWKEFVKMRKKKRAPLTEEACRLILLELNKIGQDKNNVLKQSIRNSWSDVYPLHNQGGFNGRNNPRTSAGKYAPKTAGNEQGILTSPGDWPEDHREVALG